MKNRLVIVVDIDPSGPGTYPVNRIEPPPPALETWNNSVKSVEIIDSEWDGRAVLTAHTSPLFRWDFFEDDYMDLYRRAVGAGATIAVHPHEDRDDGGMLYDDPDHMCQVVTGAHKRLTDAGIKPAAFRSSFFAFADHLPGLLSDLNMRVSLSSAPALRASEQGAVWSPQWGPDFTTARMICKENYLHASCDHDTWDVYEVPLGWSGQGTELKMDYLFNEGSSLDSLCNVWERVRRRGADTDRVQTVCFLCHGFGLGDDRWREQALRFIEFVRGCDDELVNVENLAAEIEGGSR